MELPMNFRWLTTAPFSFDISSFSLTSSSSSVSSPSTSTSLSQRYLAATPAWSDFLVVVLLSLLLFGLLWYIVKRVTVQWQQKMEIRLDIAKSKRRERGDNFRNEYGYSWDVVFVFKVYQENERLSSAQCKWSLKRIMKELTDGGLQTRLFYSCQADEVYCKVRVPLPRLKKEADRINMRCRLDPTLLKALCSEGRKVDGKTLWGPLKIPETCDETKISPYEHIYVKFENGRADVEGLYATYGEKKLPFRGVDRLKLIFSILAARKYEGGCNLDIYRLMKDEAILGFYPLHDHVELTSLAVKWLQVFQWPWNQPNGEIKDYFGEKIGLYFLWLSHYTSWLLVAAIVGFFCWINVAVNDNNPNALIMPYFATFIAFWSTLFLEFWKRKEAAHAMKWGTTGFEEEEQCRPQFIGIKKRSPIDGREYLYFNRNEEQQRAFQSSVVIWGFICIVIGTIAAIFTLKLVMNGIAAMNPDGIQFGSIIASLLNSLQITILNGIYGDIAIRLTDYENHRTDTKYEDSLIAKTFLFQFVNSYASLFYIAFVKPFIPALDPCLNSCMEELQTNLGTIFLTRLALGNLQQVVVPTILMHLKEKEQTKGVTEDISEVEKTFFMPEYHVMLGPFEDYAEMMIQFGYTTMFVAAFPLATVMSFVNNYIEMRVDAWKLCQISRRPEPRSAEDIGTWMTILQIMSIFAVMVNSGIIAFTGTYTEDYRWSARVWIFIAFTAGVLISNILLSIFIPDVSPDVEIQLARNEYLNGKVIDNIEDEVEEDVGARGLSAKANYAVFAIDNDPL